MKVQPTQCTAASAWDEVRLLWILKRPSIAAAFVAGLIPSVGLRLWPALEMNVLARGSAQVAAVFLGCPVIRDELGWTLIATPFSSTVSAACSGADFLIIAAVVLAWRLASRGLSFAATLMITAGLAGPFSIAVNAVRIVAVTQMHRWIIPLFPQSCSAFLHLATGVAVFLPALILVHATLPTTPRLRSSVRG